MAVKYTRVVPGELIRATLFNDLLTALEALEDRVAELEIARPVTRVSILGVEPVGTIAVGDVVTVKGEGFDRDTAKNTVYVGVKKIEVFKSSSDSTFFKFEMPFIPGLASDGTDLSLQVTNAEGSSASWPLRVKPLVVLPEVTPIVAYSGAPVALHADNKIAATDVYVFGFSVKPILGTPNPPAIDYQVRAVTKDPAWIATILGEGDAVLGAATTMRLAADTLSTVRVRLTVPSLGAGAKSDLALQIDAADATKANVKPGVSTLQLGIGDVVPTPESRLGVSLRSATLGASATVAGVQFTLNQLGTVSFNVVSQIAATVTFTVESPTAWERTGQPTQTLIVGMNTPAINLRPTAGATSTALILDFQATGVNPPLAFKYRMPIVPH